MDIVKSPRVLEREDPLWLEYKQTGSQQSRNRLIERYMPLVRFTAERMAKKLPGNVDVEDLANAGVFGLMKALDGFDLDREVRFETYCAIRTRGAILDELRACDWVPRLVRAKAHKVDAGTADLEKKLGRPPRDHELADHLQISMDELRDLVKGSKAVTVTSLHEGLPDQGADKSLRRIDVLEDEKAEEPSLRAMREDLFRLATETLSEREQTILVLYYYEEMTLREIGAVLDLSESRVCQLHGRIIKRLQEELASREKELLD